jgi:pyruvate dehydrogenase E2 component (dihydrolipoamide acetyltransferase)
MSVEIIMPKLSDTMEEGTVLEWRIQPGDMVRQGDVIAEVETDKAAMEMEAFKGGIVSQIHVCAGETVPVGTVLAFLSASDENVDTPLTSGTETVTELAGKAEDELKIEEPVAGHDVASVVAIAAGLVGGRKQEKSIKVRRIMARRMTEAWTTIPHFYVTYSIDMTDVIRFRKDLGTTINDFIMTAVARSLHEHPWVNSWWVNGEAIEQQKVNIAMAVATERGLYNPVLKDCARLSLKEISRRAARLAEKTHNYRLAPDDFEDGTFTISNMGMLGVESFRAIITPPQAAVLAVGTVKGEIVVDEHGEPAVAPVARMTLAADHRILDGADAAEFMVTLKSYLEAPVTLISCDYGED